MNKKEKILLLEDIKFLGKKEEILEVRRSYALNFLIPTGKAVKIKNSEKYVIRKEEYLKNKEKIENDNVIEFFNVIKKEGLKFYLKKHDKKTFSSIKPLDIVKCLNKISRENNFKFKIGEKNLTGFSETNMEGNYSIKIRVKKVTRDILVKVILV